jgi:hypothetical protein
MCTKALLLAKSLTVALVLGVNFSGNVLAEPKPLLLEGVIGNTTLKLINDQPQCQLSLHFFDTPKKIFTLKSKSPCYFFADSEQKNIQIYAYPQQQIEAVLLIGGTPLELTADIRQHKKLSIDSYCTQTIQPIVLKKESVKLGTVITNAMACASDRLDEKMYQQMLKQVPHDTEAFVILNKMQPDAESTKTPMSELSFIDKIIRSVEELFKD